MYLPAKFEVRIFTHAWDNRGTPKIWDVPGYAHAFFQIFSWACVRMDPVNVSAKFAVRGFSRFCDNSDCSFGLGLQTPNLGQEDAIGGGDGTVRKSVGEFL